MQVIISIFIFFLSLFMGYFGTFYWVDSQAEDEPTTSDISIPTPSNNVATSDVVETQSQKVLSPVTSESANVTSDSVKDSQKNLADVVPEKSNNTNTIGTLLPSESPKNSTNTEPVKKVETSVDSSGKESPSVLQSKPKKVVDTSVNPDEDLQNTMEKLFGDPKKKSSSSSKKKVPTLDNSDEELLDTINKLMK